MGLGAWGGRGRWVVVPWEVEEGGSGCPGRKRKVGRGAWGARGRWVGVPGEGEEGDSWCLGR